MTKAESVREKIKRVVKDIKPDNIMFDTSAAELTSIKAGGNVFCYFVADKIEDLKRIVGACINNKVDFMLIGDGTNILFNDKYIDLVLIKLGVDFNYLEFADEDNIVAGSAHRLFKMVVSAAARGYDFSELSGIPGTIGGSVMGNCGIRNKSVCDFVKEISYISNAGGDIREKTKVLSNSDFGYRYFYIPDLAVLTRIVLKTRKSERDDILKKIRDRVKNRKLTQPVNTKNAGCFFKNIQSCPESSGRLIERCGLKGFVYGGARISDIHANFIENFNNASSEDILVLSNIIKDMVMDKFKVKLEYELKTICF